MRLNSARLLGLLLTLLIAGATVAQAEGASTSQTFFLRNDGTDCGAASHPFLATTAGSTDLGCGYVGGGPFGEVFAALATDTSKTYTTQDAMAMLVDGTRDVTGKITVTPYVTVTGATGSGVGQIIVDIAATGATAEGDLVDLGSISKEVTATPVASRQEIPFALNVDDALSNTQITEFSLKVNIRGIHAAHGFNQLNGASSVTVPYLEPAVTTTP